MALGLLIAAVKVVDNALKLPLDHPEALVSFIMELELLPLGAVQNGVDGLFGDILDRLGQLEMIAAGQSLKIHSGYGVALYIAPAGGADAAVHNAQVGVGYDELRVHKQLNAQARAGGAGAVGVVEGEEPGRQLLNGDAAALAGVILGKGNLPVLPHQIHQHQAAGQSQGGLRGVGEPAGDIRLDDQPVHNDLNVVLFVLFQPDLLGKLIQDPVYPCPDIAGLFRVLQNLDMLALSGPDHGRQYLNPGPLGQGHDLVHDLVDALLPDLPAALGAVRHANTGPEQTEIVINLRDGAHSGAGVFGCGFLVDGDGRGKAVDIVHIRLVHLS